MYLTNLRVTRIENELVFQTSHKLFTSENSVLVSLINYNFLLFFIVFSSNHQLSDTSCHSLTIVDLPIKSRFNVDTISKYSCVLLNFRSPFAATAIPENKLFMFLF